MSDRLSDLLDRRADQGAVRPTMEGVQQAVGRRAARRRRQRAVGTGLAAVCVLAGVVGGFALARDDDVTPTAPADPVDLPEVPLVGIDLPGFVLTGARVEASPAEEDGAPVALVTFRAAGSLVGPLLTVAVESTVSDGPPATAAGRRVDLDGDGTDDAALTSTPTGGVGLVWDRDGQTIGVGGYGVAEGEVLDYATTLYGRPVEPATAPTPEGFPERTLVTVPSGLDTEQAVATYQNGEREVRVTVTNEPGWFDFLQLFGTSTSGGFEEATLGDTFLGPGEAILSEPRAGYGYALARTDAGLSIELSTDGAPTAPAELRDLLARGRLVEVDPDVAPAAEDPDDAPTLEPPDPVTTTSIVGEATTTGMGGSGTTDGPVTLTELTIGPTDQGTRVVVAFEGGVPEWEIETADGPTPPGEGDCAPPTTPGRYLRLVLGSPGGGQVAESTVLPGSSTGLDGVTATLSCAPYEGVARVDIRTGGTSFDVQELSNPARLAIDIPT